MKKVEFTSGSIYKGLLRFCLPLFISNILTLCYNIADTIIVGRLLGNEALAGVGSTGTLMFLINGVSIGFTTGSSIITARYFGAKDGDGIKRSVASGIVLATSVGILLTVIVIPLLPFILRLMNTDKAFYDEAYRYIFVIMAGFLAMIAYKLSEAVLRAVGISHMSLIFAIVSFLSNIVLDVVFIEFCNMGTEGASLATVLSFLLCAVLCVGYIVKKVPELHIKRKHFAFDKEMYLSQLKMALPMSVQQSIKGLGSTLVQSSYNTLGTVAVAAFAVSGKIEHITTDAYNAIGSAMSTFCGQNIGANKKGRIKKGIKAALVMGTLYTVATGALLIIFAKHFTPMFVKEDVSAVAKLVGTFMLSVAPFFVLLCTLVTLRYSIQGMGYSAFALGAGVIELVMRAIMSYIGKSANSFVITSLSFPVSWGVTALYLVIVYFGIIRRKLQ